MLEKRRALIFANGDISDLQAAQTMLNPGDTLIAADGGMRHLRHLGRTPDLVVGDLDSLPENELSRLEQAGVRVVRFPTHKNETDLELALQAAVEQGFDVIIIMGALGGRLDQTLGNINLLAAPFLQGKAVHLDDGRQEVFRITSAAEIRGEPGDTVSLLPVEGEAQGVTTVGLKYPLDGETLYSYQTRGISNVMQGKTARVELSRGVLLCVHTRGRVD